MTAVTGMQNACDDSLGVGQQDFDVFMDHLIQENPDVPFCEGRLLSLAFSLTSYRALQQNSPLLLSITSLEPSFCIGDLDLISELLPDLPGFDGLSTAQSSNSKANTASSLADTSVRPIAGQQAELDGMAFLQNAPETFDSYAPTASGNIYEAARNTAPTPRTAPYQVQSQICMQMKAPKKRSDGVKKPSACFKLRHHCYANPHELLR